MLRKLIKTIDKHLREKQGIFEFWVHPNALIRVGFTTNKQPIPVNKSAISPGSHLLEIHFWNEHVPSQKLAKSPIAWAAKSATMLRDSFQELAFQLVNDPRFNHVEFIGGSTPLVLSGQHGGGEKIWRRLGFHLCIPQSTRPWSHFWENLYTWLIIWTFNPDGVGNKNPFTMHRVEFWADRQTFIAHHYRPKPQS
ncbi:hypothetical protein TERTU_3239 [Teredinibacter turnerae T7901]|uniref:YkoP-like domain-containing protein n=1 Tax=Teredinibacter turnerae (strain ATCC 39867 / T7901) TaxID=377629 RepID=C5BPY0_TERTT|nr:hypothetical protein [Teredinibacter turnerae]ACR12339.1 hypothetical protein TERTU_3239 [Teredinibacter turnerae T7901]